MSIINDIVNVDIFETDTSGNWKTGQFVGRPFNLNFSSAQLLVADSWKQKCKGLQQGSFLLAYYDNEPENPEAAEAVLLRVLKPTSLPTDNEIIASMVEYYKDGIRTGETNESQLDTFTRYEFSFSGVECGVLGSFYRDKDGVTKFGADLENFFSAHHYNVYKPNPAVLGAIVNYRPDGVPGGPGDVRIGKVRYSSSMRFQSREDVKVPVYVQAPDFAGKRTALFGMTRTGKSNTLKKIIQACVEMSQNATFKDIEESHEAGGVVLEPFDDDKNPKYPIGQIVFDINGEYANANLQDQGTAIFDMYKEITDRYSTIKKTGFKEMKVNFYKEVEEGFELIRSYPTVSDDNTKYMNNFKSVQLSKPDDYSSNVSAKTRYDRKLAVYLCCLRKAGFDLPAGFQVSFTAGKKVCDAIGQSVEPKFGLDIDDAATWWEVLWEQYESANFFKEYKKTKGKEWADEDLKALLIMLTRKRTSGGSTDCNGFLALRSIKNQHTSTNQMPFDLDILNQLRKGRIVIVDLSQGDPAIQTMFSERICRKVFSDSMSRFTQTKPNNFIQFYFEEAHNLFPKKDDKDLSQIYNRLAKEGAKLNLGLIYATQEVSSISSNILKNTQNWFISHLNNEDEIRELRKFYDFGDFTDQLIRFSQDTDKGFIRMKSYSNPFVIPVQVDRFPPETN